ncbi:MAG: hypothetical protein A2719_03915 [Candidatus Ryanbacteria bacterium RIFCSPHIGHO2_01_FULL_45_22]|uniref:HTH deoR-type domain-containing protein n=1 Tax=Candidatus Ryanbacteria bacterium RIFCSPHIGHO2_01_FULL_45_22 TaxID=1802114 RepID=A0A1G2FZY6_9BACT|nr:MAG: hypothetical protein A2719_03915 [Candidatus Ryanbacteria bacterium RIFCSPHIGHO2_01_FULL_45_22]
MPEVEERTKNFINTVIFVSRIFSGLKDKFLARKLYDKLSDFVSVYSLPPKDNVAQYSTTLLTTTNSLLELLDYLEHSKTTAATPLLYARRSLFAFKLQLIRIQPGQPIIEKERAASPVTPKIKKEINLSGNKEKILNYIKRSPDSRTKDIIYEFSVLSERTVKRNLKELVSGGLVKKSSKDKDKAVYYHVI